MEQNYSQIKHKFPRTSVSHTLPPTSLIPKSQTSIGQFRPIAENSLTSGYDNTLTEDTLIEDEDSIYEIDPECIRCKKNQIYP